MTVVQLREYAREKKVRLPYGVNKAKLIELLNHELREEQKEEESGEIGLYKPKPLGFYDEEYGTSNPVVPKMLKAGLLAGGRGVLEVQPAVTAFCGRRTVRRDRTISMCRLHRFAGSDCAAAMKSSERRAPSAWAIDITR